MNSYDVILFPCQGGAGDYTQRNGGPTRWATSSTTPTPAGASSPRTSTTSCSTERHRHDGFEASANWAVNNGRGTRPAPATSTSTDVPARERSRSGSIRPSVYGGTLGQIPVGVIRNDFTTSSRRRSAGCTRQTRRTTAWRTCPSTTRSTRRPPAAARAVRPRALQRLPRRGRANNNANGQDLPGECTRRRDDAAGEAARVHALRPDVVRDARRSCTPRPARQQSINCGPAGRRLRQHAQLRQLHLAADLRRRRRRRRSAATPTAAAARRRPAPRRASSAARPATAAAISSVRHLRRAADLRRRRHRRACGTRRRRVHAEDLRGAGHQLRPGRRRLRQPAQLRHLPAAADLRRRRRARPVRLPGRRVVHAHDLRARRASTAARRATAAATSSSCGTCTAPADLRRRRLPGPVRPRRGIVHAAHVRRAEPRAAARPATAAATSSTAASCTPPATCGGGGVAGPVRLDASRARRDLRAAGLHLRSGRRRLRQPDRLRHLPEPPDLRRRRLPGQCGGPTPARAPETCAQQDISLRSDRRRLRQPARVRHLPCGSDLRRRRRRRPVRRLGLVRPPDVPGSRASTAARRATAAATWSSAARARPRDVRRRRFAGRVRQPDDAVKTPAPS